MAAALLLAGCGGNPLSANGAPGHTLTLSVGQELNLKLQNIGPGTYDTPPAIAGESVRFLGMGSVPYNVPAGVTQLFRFYGSAAGQALITFHQSYWNTVVVDTVNVR
jgi:hypothetical protein